MTFNFELHRFDTLKYYDAKQYFYKSIQHRSQTSKIRVYHGSILIALFDVLLESFLSYILVLKILRTTVPMIHNYVFELLTYDHQIFMIMSSTLLEAMSIF